MLKRLQSTAQGASGQLQVWGLLCQSVCQRTGKPVHAHEGIVDGTTPRYDRHALPAIEANPIKGFIAKMNSVKLSVWLLFLMVTGVLFLQPGKASVQLTHSGVMNQVATMHFTEAQKWQVTMMNAAQFLFWTPGIISLVWTGVQMAFRQADPGEMTECVVI